MATHETTKALTKTQIEERAVVNIAELVPEDKVEEVREITQEILDTRQQIGMGILKMGELLSRLQDALPRTFYAYAKTIPGLSTASVTRYIAAYKNAKEQLPEPIVAAALAAGVDIVSYDKKKPFGKFTTVVKKFPPPKGKDITPEAAEHYIRTLTIAQREAAKKKGKVITIVSADVTRELFQTAYRKLNRLSEDEREDVIREVFSSLLGIFGVEHELHITPTRPSDELTEGLAKPKGRPREEGQPQAVAPAKKKRPRSVRPPEGGNGGTQAA